MNFNSKTRQIPQKDKHQIIKVVLLNPNVLVQINGVEEENINTSNIVVEKMDIDKHDVPVIRKILEGDNPTSSNLINLYNK